MRRQRPDQLMPQPPPERGGKGPAAPVVATDQSDVIAPFLASGGYTFWPSHNPVTDGGGSLRGVFPPLTKDGTDLPYSRWTAWVGAQLVTSVFCPWGKVGFCKEVRIAPLKPSILSDVWNTSGITAFAPVADPADAMAFGTYQAHRGLETYTALWDTPMGWESYDTSSRIAPVHSPEHGGYIPDPWHGEELGWQWQLTLLDGSIPQYRTAANIPPFEPSIIESWYMAESIPVPLFVYSNGLPGRPAGPMWSPQRMQVLPGDSLKTHVVIPSNTTLCLWAVWCNTLNLEDTGEGDEWVPGVRLQYADTLFPGGFGIGAAPPSYAPYYPGSPADAYTWRVPIIGPSVGSLHGYIQPEASHGSNENAVIGWGG